MILAPKHGTELTESDLKEHSVWVSYYEPDEIELLAQLGFDEVQVNKALSEIEFSDEYVFPVPSGGAALPFNYLHLSALVTIPDGRKLQGYRTRASLCVMHEGRSYHFNKALRSLSEEQESELCSLLKLPTLFPASVYLPAVASTEEFSLVTSG
jgi:hypothetical protein